MLAPIHPSPIIQYLIETVIFVAAYIPRPIARFAAATTRSGVKPKCSAITFVAPTGQNCASRERHPRAPHSGPNRARSLPRPSRAPCRGRQDVLLIGPVRVRGNRDVPVALARASASCYRTKNPNPGPTPETLGPHVQAQVRRAGLVSSSRRPHPASNQTGTPEANRSGWNAVPCSRRMQPARTCLLQ